MTNSDDNNVAAQQKKVEKAARARNPLEPVADVFRFVSKDEDYTMYCKAKPDMDPKVIKWAYKLAERNVGPLYKELSMGWQPKVKQNDLNKNWARYLVALDNKNSRSPVAYSMFRFDMDYGHCVLYCYEMQIAAASQRKGLGKFMMNVLEQCSRHWQMEKVVLTVLKNNPNAAAFFRAVGYTLDDSSPDVLEKAEYEILSKQIK